MWICLDFTHDVVNELCWHSCLCKTKENICSYTASLQNKTENIIQCVVHVLRFLSRPCAFMKIRRFTNLINEILTWRWLCVCGSRGLPAMYTEIQSAFIILRLDESWNLQLMISNSTVVEIWVEGNMAVVTTGACCHALSSEMDTEAFGVNWLG